MAPGLLVTFAIAAVVWLIAPLTPQTQIIGASVLAIIAGIALRSAIGLPKALAPGVRFSSRRVLQTAIVLLGTGLSLSQVWDTGRSSLAVLLGTLIGGLAVMLTLGRLLKIDRTLTRLISVGTGICGGLAHILLTESYRLAPASLIAPFDYTSMLWTLILGFFILGEVPSVLVFIGAGIIAAAGLFVIWRERQLGLQRQRAAEAAT